MASPLKITFDNIKEEYQTGQIVEAEIVIVSDIDIDFKEFGFKLIIESRGKVGTFENIIKTVRILTKTTILKNTTYRYPISFTNKKFETYIGFNVSFVIKIETYGVLSESLVNKSLLPLINLFNLFDPNKQWATDRYIKFTNKNNELSIKENYITLESIHHNKSSIFILVFSFMSFFGMINSEKLAIFSLVPLLIFISYIFYLLISYTIIGIFKVYFQQIDNKLFETNCSSNKNWKFITSAKISYQIKEEVIDRRGTSEETHTCTRFNSKVTTYNKPKGELKCIHEFPNNKPASMTLENSRVYWNFQLNLQTVFKLKYQYSGIFTTEKINS